MVIECHTTTCLFLRLLRWITRVTKRTFVTFIWDNDDINPESLRGQSLHCTNGIVLKLSRVALNLPEPNSTATSLPNPKEKLKKYQEQTIKMPTYIQIKRQNPNIETKVQRNMYEEAERRSHVVDTVWVIAKLHAAANNCEHAIPNWTGFNYMLCDEESDEYHKIGYLPAINQSPTSHETELELLSQSKLKAEKLGLTETDVVLDMAICSKAVEITLNPKYVNLKKIIVLRLEAFHTSCIFMAVIGKRFGDAGLRDIESNLLGESSVEQMLKGKHYNNAVRVLKYLYDAVKRHMIESFEKSVRDQSEELDVAYGEFVNSVALQNFVLTPTKKSIEALFHDHEGIINKINNYEKSLLQGSCGPTASVWSSFLKMVQILFDFLRGIELGDWELHLQATENMLPWMFAFDRPNYTRFLT